MELPEPVRKLIGELGEHMVQAILQDEHSRELALQLHEAGYDLVLMLEATLVPRTLLKAVQDAVQELVEDPSQEPESEGEQEDEQVPKEKLETPDLPKLIPRIQIKSSEAPPEGIQWSKEDQAFLRTFRISVD